MYSHTTKKTKIHMEVLSNHALSFTIFLILESFIGTVRSWDCQL